MKLLDRSFSSAAELANPQDFSVFQSHIDPKWIDEALKATGTATVRRRRLPAELVIWLVLGMCLFRNRSMFDVVSKLDLALPGVQPTTARSAISQARSRLGDEPMRWLFNHSAQQWAHASADRNRWNGLALYGIDGTILRVPDSEQNRHTFGVPKGGNSDGTLSYPTVRMVALMALRSHLIAGASFGPYAKGEYEYAKDLWEQVPDKSLIIADRNFLSANLLHTFSSKGDERHWLVRAKGNTAYKVLKHLGPNDELVKMTVSTTARKKNPNLPATWVARVITYQIKGFPPQKLLTSLLDPTGYPALEIVSVYHQRWEIEFGYGEIKTDMHKGEQTIRSQLPTGVNQEIWGILMAYNLIRLEIERIADEAGVAPTRISFVAAARYIQDEWMWCAIASPGAIPGHLKRLRETVKMFVLPERRSGRSYPRTVKRAASVYKRRKATPQAPLVLK